MDKVLIVDKDAENLKKIEKGFKELHHFELLTTQSGKTAVDILKKTKITVLITDLILPDLDGVQLLAYMTRNYPATPCVVMMEPGKPRPWFKDRSGHGDMLYYLEKPFEFGALASIIFVGLNLKDEGLAMRGMTLRHFLPLLVLGRKTGCMEVTSGGRKKGLMYFDTGVLLDAQHNNLTGDQAAREMAKWEGVGISFSSLPKNRAVQKINTKLMEIAGAVWKEKPKPRPAPGPNAAGQPTPVSQAAPPSAPSAGNPSKLQSALTRHVNILRTIKGYLGLAILNPAGNVLATDVAAESIDIKDFAKELNTLFASCSKTVNQKGLDRCTSFTIHTGKAVIMMMSADVYKQGNFRFVGLMAPEGNGFFMQTQLKRIIPQVLTGS